MSTLIRHCAATLLAAFWVAASAAPPAAVPGAFADNPIVYFVVTDRFLDGDAANDDSYGRKREPDPKNDVGTFHGGDLKGLTTKLKEGWFKQLGVNAIWITAPYEQIHGWVVGGNKEFKHYAYHGYYALDYTLLDKAMGTPDDLRTFEYWQRCFDRWPSHPYAKAHDARIPAAAPSRATADSME